MPLRIIARNIMQAMGRYSEISRRDRDHYVRIVWQNVKPGKYRHAGNSCIKDYVYACMHGNGLVVLVIK